MLEVHGPARVNLSDNDNRRLMSVTIWHSATRYSSVRLVVSRCVWCCDRLLCVCVVQIIYVCCDRLLDIAGRSCSDETHRALLFHTSNRLIDGTTAVAPNSTGGDGSQASMASAAASQFFAADSSKPATLSVRSESRLQVINLHPSVSCESFLPVSVHGRLSPLPPLTSRQLSSSGYLPPMNLRQSWTPAARSHDHISLPGVPTAAGHTGTSTAERVGIVMASTEYPPAALAKIESYKLKLNMSAAEWKRLSVEDDPHVLSALMWDWIDELKVRTTTAYWPSGCLLHLCMSVCVCAEHSVISAVR